VPIGITKIDGSAILSGLHWQVDLGSGDLMVQLKFDGLQIFNH